jgi:hypothetical protein
MSVIDPFLDGSPHLASSQRLEGRDLVMLRHDIRGALQGVIGAVDQIDVEALGAGRSWRARLPRSRLSRTCRSG